MVSGFRLPAGLFWGNDRIWDFALDAGNSRFYGGIHYRPSINTGLGEGKIVGGHIINNLSRFSDRGK
jgi:hypothetical protein